LVFSNWYLKQLQGPDGGGVNVGVGVGVLVGLLVGVEVKTNVLVGVGDGGNSQGPKSLIVADPPLVVIAPLQAQSEVPSFGFNVILCKLLLQL
jgi:hypothetical protein